MIVCFVFKFCFFLEDKLSEKYKDIYAMDYLSDNLLKDCKSGSDFN